jgi:hypothetical protein
MEENDLVKLEKKTWNIEKIFNMKSFILLYGVNFDEAHYVFVSKEGIFFLMFIIIIV